MKGRNESWVVIGLGGPFSLAAGDVPEKVSCLARVEADISGGRIVVSLLDGQRVALGFENARHLESCLRMAAAALLEAEPKAPYLMVQEGGVQ